MKKEDKVIAINKAEFLEEIEKLPSAVGGYQIWIQVGGVLDILEKFVEREKPIETRQTF